MKVIAQQVLPSEFTLREVIRSLSPDTQLVVECEDIAEVRSVGNNAYQTRKDSPRVDGFDYQVSINTIKKVVTISLHKI